MNQEAERECVRRARIGDRDAFARLLDVYWDRVRRWLVGLTGHAQTAEDLTQEAFLKAWSALPKLQAEETFRVWLFRIARHCLLDRRRGPRGRLPQALAGDVADRQPGPLDQVLEAELMERLQTAVASLPVTYRAAYLLWTHEGLPYLEIAGILGVGTETARWRVCLARQMLRKEMQSYLDKTPS